MVAAGVVDISENYAALLLLLLMEEVKSLVHNNNQMYIKKIVGGLMHGVHKNALEYAGGWIPSCKQ